MTDSPEPTLESVVEPNNLDRAARRVISNGGSAGPGNLTTQGLKRLHDPSRENSTYDVHPRYLSLITDKVVSERWKAHPVLRRWIPKYGPEGEVRSTVRPDEESDYRPLGIPTVLDRIVQQAILQVLDPLWDPQFSRRSFAFRSGRSQRGALDLVKQHLWAGYHYVVNADLKSYFDTVPHAPLMDLLRVRIEDCRLLRLIKRFLEAGVLEDGVRHPTTEGVPQGGPLSPFLSNLYLDQLDKELERREHLHVRYADDFLIFKRSKAAARRVMRSVSDFLTRDLGLTINTRKSEVCHAHGMNFLGFSIYLRLEAVFVAVKQKNREKAERKLDALRREHSSIWETYRHAASQYLHGWGEYFEYADDGAEVLASLRDYASRDSQESPPGPGVRGADSSRRIEGIVGRSTTSANVCTPPLEVGR